MCVVDINSRVCCLAAPGDPEGTINILLTKCKSKFKSRAIPVHVAMLPRNFEDKYHSRPHPLLIKCEARAISRVPVLMRAIELRLYARLVSSAWWRRRLDHAVLFKSFISVTHCPSQRNWWIVQIYGIPMPEQVGIFFRGFARLMKVSHCSSGSSLMIAMTWRTARARILNVKSQVNKQLPVDFMGVKCVSVECDQPRRWIHFKTYLFQLICRQSI